MRVFSGSFFLAAIVAASACNPAGTTPGSGGSTATTSSTGQAGGAGHGGQAGSGGAGGQGGGGGDASAVLGLPCTILGCTTGYCGALGYCTADCQTDADCAPSAGPSPNRCLATSEQGEQQCFAGCASDADCKAGVTGSTVSLTCRSVGSGGKVCTLAQDTSTPPLCQPDRYPGPSCTFGTDCHCGETCFDIFGEGDGNGGTSCGYSCTTNQDCITATNGIFTVCWMGNGQGDCGPQ